MAIANTNMTIEEATRYWVRGFNAIPQGFITNFDNWYDHFHEVMPDMVVCKQCEAHYAREEHEEFEDIQEAMGKEELQCRNCKSVDNFIDYQEYQSEKYTDIFPMWGWMWTFEESFDEVWALENLDIMYRCGFRVYENEDLGVVIGIDGAGYDFYEEHWIPLYKARGLQWHTREE